jgi:hypothetical protein
MFLKIKLRRRDFLYWGLFDPKPLTEGPEAHVPGHTGQVWLGRRPSSTSSLAPAATGGGGARAWEEEGRGVHGDRKLTRRSPVCSVRPEERRRWRNRRRRSSGLRRKTANRRRLRLPRVDSIDREEEGGAAEFQGRLLELGEAQNGDGERRHGGQARDLQVLRRGREARGHGRRGKKRGERVGHRGSYPLVLEVGAIIQADGRGAVASGGHGAARQLPACLRKKIGKG